MGHKSTGHAGEKGMNYKGQHLVPEYIDSHSRGGYFILSNGLHGPAKAAFDQAGDTKNSEDSHPP
jgi:hypothetical protein